MRLNPLMYLGDSIPRHGTALLGNAGSAWEAAVTGAPVVRSNMDVDAGNVPEFALDLAAIEREARAAQAAWIASNLKSFYAALLRKFSHPGQAARDEWPASTQSLDDSEDRAPAETAPLPRPVAKTYSGVEMRAMADKATDWSSIYDRLDTIRMSEYERRQAKESLRKAELIVELVLPVAAAMRAILHGVEHAAVSMASGIKTLFAKPVRH